jgi:hypothetical protein
LQALGRQRGEGGEQGRPGDGRGAERQTRTTLA